MMNTTTETALNTVMVIDDEPENLNVLDAALARTGHRMLFFTDGKRALEAARAQPPDLVLLDVRMPGMDGHEVCRQFKADARLCDIPVLFLSAHSSVAEITKGFESGAVDYIAKPFWEAEVTARVRTHLALRNAYAHLARQHQELLVLERQRDAYVHMLVHDMRSPLMAMLGNLQMLTTYGDDNLTERDRESLRAAIHSTRALGRMVSSVVDLSRMESARMKLKLQFTTADELFRSACEQVLDPSTSRAVTEDIHPQCPLVCCDVDLAVRILGNLLANAVKYSDEVPAIIVGASPDPEGVRLWVQDNGPGIALDRHESIFEKFEVGVSHGGNRQPSSGIGLAFCKLAIELHGGRIGVQSTPGHGSTFWILFPTPSPASCFAEGCGHRMTSKQPR